MRAHIRLDSDQKQSNGAGTGLHTDGYSFPTSVLTPKSNIRNGSLAAQKAQNDLRVAAGDCR